MRDIKDLKFKAKFQFIKIILYEFFIRLSEFSGLKQIILQFCSSFYQNLTEIFKLIGFGFLYRELTVNFQTLNREIDKYDFKSGILNSITFRTLFCYRHNQSPIKNNRG